MSLFEKGCSGKMSCDCKQCTELTAPASSGAYGGRNVQPTADQKKAIKEKAKQILKNLKDKKDKGIQLVRLQEEVLGQTLFSLKNYELDSPKAAVAIAQAQVLNLKKEIPGFSNGAVAVMAKLVGAERPTIAEARDLLSKVAEAEAKKGGVMVDHNKALADGSLKAAQILESAMLTYDTRRDQCDAFSAYNPALMRFSPAEVESKRLECGANNDGTCVAQGGGGLYPFACTPSFEACMAGDAEACSVVAQQLKAGSVEDLKNADGSFPKTKIKPGSDADKLLKAWDKVWGHQSPLTNPNAQFAYDMLIVAMLMDLETFRDEKKNSVARYGQTFDAHNREPTDRIWNQVQVPIIKMINRANKNPSTYENNVKKMLGNKYALYVNMEPAELEAKMFQLRDSTDLMAMWLANPLFNYVVKDTVKLSQMETAVFLMGIDLMKSAMGIL
jgi:hypothetical protein